MSDAVAVSTSSVVESVASGGAADPALEAGSTAQAAGSRLPAKDTPEEREARLQRMSEAAQTLIEGIGEDTGREGLLKTPRRVAKALLEMTSGYGLDAGAVLRSALFNVHSPDLVVVQDIDFSSNCEHHMLPFFGKVHIGYIPTGKVVGLSKLARITDIFSKRLQVQERMTRQIAECLMDNVGAAGVAVMCEATHMCMAMRGASKPGAFTTSTCYLGDFKGVAAESVHWREEFHRQLRNARRGT